MRTMPPPLHWACRGGHIEIARLLIEHGADVNARNDDYTTPLHLACLNGDADLVRLLLSHGADPLARNDYDRTPVEGIKDLAKREEIERAMQRYIEDKITSSPSGI